MCKAGSGAASSRRLRYSSNSPAAAALGLKHQRWLRLPSKIASTISGASSASRRILLTYDFSIPWASAISVTERFFHALPFLLRFHH